MKPLDLSQPATALDLYFGNGPGEVRVAFMLIATPFAQGEVGETSVISNITDAKALARIIRELENAMQLKQMETAGRA